MPRECADVTEAVATLLAAHAALPESYQPAWGLDGSRNAARRGCDDRLAVILPLLEAWPEIGRPIRILDIGCAQGYFTLGIAHALAIQGRKVEVVGVDNLDANVRFCRALAAHHGIAVEFLNERFDANFFERHGDAQWDVLLALNVLHHMQRADDDVAAAVEAMRRHTRVALCELAQREEGLAWMHKLDATDPRLFGSYAFRRQLASFQTHLGDVQRPLYACSDRLAWVAQRWFPFGHVAERSHPGVPDAFAGQRRFFFGSGVVVKAYCGDGPYGAFNRAELESEVAVLADLADEPRRYPSVYGRDDDGDLVWLARDLLPGRLLSERLSAGEPFDREGVVRSLLVELVHLEARGFHHGDLRCWNVLLHDGAVRLIDFGAMTRRASPLQRVALAAMLLEIAEGRLRHAQPFYAALHGLAAYPPPWHALVRCLLETPAEVFHYTLALAAFENSGAVSRSGPLVPADDVLAAIAQEQVEAFQRLQEHATVTACRADALTQELAAAARERAKLEASRREAEIHAESLGQAFKEAQSYSSSLKDNLAESHAFAESLRERIERESADAATERAAFEAARRKAETFAESLHAALEESRQYADSLRARLEIAHGTIAHWQERHARMQRRFRLLKFLWPRESEDRKETE